MVLVGSGSLVLQLGEKTAFSGKEVVAHIFFIHNSQNKTNKKKTNKRAFVLKRNGTSYAQEA